MTTSPSASTATSTSAQRRAGATPAAERVLSATLGGWG
jgi:hypothetical protein